MLINKLITQKEVDGKIMKEYKTILYAEKTLFVCKRLITQ